MYHFHCSEEGSAPGHPWALYGSSQWSIILKRGWGWRRGRRRGEPPRRQAKAKCGNCCAPPMCKTGQSGTLCPSVTFPTSVVVGTYRSLECKACQCWDGRDAKGQKQHLGAEGRPSPTLNYQKYFPPTAWDKQCKQFPPKKIKPLCTPGSANRHNYSASMPPGN